MKKALVFLGVLSFLQPLSRLHAEEAAPLKALARMPVKEITVFKDGHAFLLHEGIMPVDAAGNIALDYLPSPLLGTFWPYSADRNARLSAVTASQRKVLVPRTALTLKELIEANPGSEVVVTELPAASGKEVQPLSYPAAIVEVPRRSGEELESVSPPYSGEKLPQKGNVVLLKTVEGLKVISLDWIKDVTFKSEPRKKLENEEFRNLLTLELDWADGQPGKEAAVGLIYVQKGIRWIPNYRIALNGQGNAAVKLNATLINELADLTDVTAHLVVGVPSFTFKDKVDPMSLDQTVVQLSRHFAEDARSRAALSNVIMTQVAEAAPGGEEPLGLEPEAAGTEKSGDFFIYDLKHVTLKKGQRMALTLGESTLPYKSIYSLDVPFTPPLEVARDLQAERQSEVARLIAAPKVMHKIRLSNNATAPLTTAPALLLSDGRVLAQGMMKFTPPGGETDIDLTAAVDILVDKTENETKRTPNAATWLGKEYGRIDLAGKITLTNLSREIREVQVTRCVLGNVGEADSGGKAEMVNIFEDSTFAAAADYPYWWRWYSWPEWWSHFNGVGRIKWTVELEPGKPVDLNYTWHYYWR